MANQRNQTGFDHIEGNLIFDITAEGAGVEGFQSFRNEDGEPCLQAEPTVLDGEQTINLTFSTFAPGQDYQFSIDLDDQLTQSELGQIRVSGSEITGATLTFDIVNGTGDSRKLTGVFDESTGN